MNNPEVLIDILQIGFIVLSVAAGICLITAVALFFASRAVGKKAPGANRSAPQPVYPAPGAPVQPPPAPPAADPAAGTSFGYGAYNRPPAESGVTEVLPNRGRYDPPVESGVTEVLPNRGRYDPPAESGVTEVLRDRDQNLRPDSGSQGTADDAAAADCMQEAATAKRRYDMKFEIVKENMLIHSDEEIPLD